MELLADASGRPELAASLIEEARRRQRRRRAVGAALLVAGAAAAAAVTLHLHPSGWPKAGPASKDHSVQPRREAIVTLLSGREWNLVGYRTNHGLCLAYGAPGVSASGCAPRRSPVDLVVAEVALAPQQGASRHWRIVGRVAPRVARLVLSSRGSRLVARLHRAPARLATSDRFFALSAPAPNWTLRAFDHAGQLLERMQS